MRDMTIAVVFDKQSEYFDQRFEAIELQNQIVPSKTFENCTFVRCNFSETDFNKSKFCDCIFDHCNLSLMKIKSCIFNTVKFRNSKLVGVNWTEVAWPTIKLACPIHFSESDISHATFFGVNLREAMFVKCRIHDVDFREADLTRANLQYSDLLKSLFMHSDLTEADFSYADHYRIDVNFNKITRAKFMLPEAVALLYSLDIELIDAG